MKKWWKCLQLPHHIETTAQTNYKYTKAIESTRSEWNEKESTEDLEKDMQTVLSETSSLPGTNTSDKELLNNVKQKPN